MKLLTKYNIIILLIGLSLNAASQDVDPVIVLDSAQSKIQNIKSYTADAIIDVDIDFLRMEPKTAKISYEYPNKLDIDTKGFVMIPKYGFRPFMKTINSEDNQVVFSGYETINEHECYLITLLPKASGKIVMLKLWVRMDDYLIQQSENFTRRQGNFLINFEYGENVLPEKMTFHFETKGINMPWEIIGNSIEVDKSKINEDELESGKVTITFSNYSIEYSEN